MRNVILGLLIMMASLGAVAKSVGGYGNTKWGMTPEQVVNAEGAKVRKLHDPEKYKGSWGLVKTDNVNIANSNFEVTYLFSNEHLVQVNVAAKEKKNSLINNDVFKRLESLLTQKYGSPTYSDPGKETVWNMEGTSISLDLLNIDGVISNLVVSYRPSSRASSESSAL